MSQISFFDGSKPLKITKPLRLIELFAGYGSQAIALENMNVPFEIYRVCEFDRFAIQSYNSIHNTQFPTIDIRDFKGEDLGIVDKDKFTYLMFYSFPCTDLSLAGKQMGMAKGSGTRSGLLWEVERLLTETKELPDILVCENVPQVLTAEGIADWIEFLESLGYTNKWDVFNTADYGIPQHRERAFIVSWLGDYYYNFDEDGGDLKYRLKDYLEENVDEKYYLSEESVEKLVEEK